MEKHKLELLGVKTNAQYTNDNCACSIEEYKPNINALLARMDLRDIIEMCVWLRTSYDEGYTVSIDYIVCGVIIREALINAINSRLQQEGFAFINTLKSNI